MLTSVKETDFKSHSLIGMNGSVISWVLNYKTGDFQVTKKSTDSKLNEISVVSCIEDLLSCIKEKNKFLKYLKDIIEEKERKPLRIFINLDEIDVMYCVITATKNDTPTLYGEILLLFKLPKKNQFSDFFISMFDNQHQGMIITDKNSKIVACNQYFEQSTGYYIHELLGKNTNIFKSGKHDESFYIDMWVNIHYHGYWSGKILNKHKDGSIIAKELTIQALNFNEHSTYYLGISKDLSNTISYLSTEHYGGVDLSTQLSNEQAFLKKLKLCVEEIPENKGLLTVVIDPEIPDDNNFGFKMEMSKALAFENNNNSWICGYLKGNKFIISTYFDVTNENLEKNLPKSELAEIINFLKQNLSQYNFYKFTQAKLGISILGEDARDAQELYKHAVIAQKEQHLSSQKNICIYDQSLHYLNKRRKRLEIIAKKAIRTKSVEVYYQPIVNVHTWKVSKFEALCRFRDTNGTLLNSQEMVNIIESMNLIEELDLIVAEKSIQDKDILSAKFDSDIEICINISLNTPNSSESVINRLICLLDKYGDAGKYITLEITESAYFDHCNGHLSSLCNKLKSRGISIAIDDFGTGFSSFLYLKNSTFNILKIDGQLIKGIEESSRNYHMVKMLIKLAKTFDIKTVAEGVETIEEVILLHKIGIDFIQGYYFSEPKPVIETRPISSLLYKLKKTFQENELITFITEPITLLPESSLEEVQDIFEVNDYSVLPVINKNRCVGLINKINYSINVPPSLGTAAENIKDKIAMKKKVFQVMDPNFHTVNHNITISEVVDNIRKDIKFPWVAEDENNNYVGIIEQERVLKVISNM